MPEIHGTLLLNEMRTRCIRLTEFAKKLGVNSGSVRRWAREDKINADNLTRAVEVLRESAPQIRITEEYFLTTKCDGDSYRLHREEMGKSEKELGDEIAEANGLADENRVYLANVERIREAESGLVTIWFQRQLDDALLEKDGVFPPSTAASPVQVVTRENDKFETLPFRRNPFFCGREAFLSHLHSLAESNDSPIVAVAGLGGIGKTQLTIEYCHRHGSSYSRVFWMGANTESDVQNGFASLCRQLDLSWDPSDRESAVFIGKSWLAKNSDWLLVFDNADSPEHLESYLPQQVNGQVILTSRAQNFDSLGLVTKVRLSEFSENESVEFFLQRIKRPDAVDDQFRAVVELNQELRGLPLALEQAAAYVATHEVVDIREYLAQFRTQRIALLEKYTPNPIKYPDSVATTWLLNFEQVKKESQPATDLLRFTSFLANATPIPYDYIIRSVDVLPSALSNLVTSSTSKHLAVLEAIAPLARYSLVTNTPEDETYSIHLLVQEVVRNLDHSNSQ